MHHHTGADAKCRARGRLTLGSSVSPSGVRGCSSMVEPLPSKQITRVRFPSSAPEPGKPRASWPGAFALIGRCALKNSSVSDMRVHSPRAGARADNWQR